jgi:hypothetical protein
MRLLVQYFFFTFFSLLRCVVLLVLCSQQVLMTYPLTHTSNPNFRFTADEGGVSYEYRVWDPLNFKELRAWTPVTSKTSVGE